MPLQRLDRAGLKCLPVARVVGCCCPTQQAWSSTHFPTPLPTAPLHPPLAPSYEFTTPSGLHVALSTAAQRGNVYFCSVSSSTAPGWEAAREAAGKVVKSFRIKRA